MEPAAKKKPKTHKQCSWCFIFSHKISYISTKYIRDHLLLYEAVPVLLYKIPGEQVACKAIADSVDDQRQLLCLDGVPLQTCL